MSVADVPFSHLLTSASRPPIRRVDVGPLRAPLKAHWLPLTAHSDQFYAPHALLTTFRGAGPAISGVFAVLWTPTCADSAGSL